MQKKVKISEYLAIMEENEPLRRLMVTGADCKLALTTVTDETVLYMLYGVMMGDYSALHLPITIAGYVLSAPFFALTVQTPQRHGQKVSLMRYVVLALAMHVGVLALLLL